MVDLFGREINYLRVSLTDHCNFRCIYCMPEEGAGFCSKEEALSFEELRIVLEAAVNSGFTKFRLTGGEPLLAPRLLDVISFLKSFPEVKDISLTTNGYLLAEKASQLLEAGLDRVNISLDTLKADRFKEVARRGELDRVWRGIDAALQEGLNPVKINCVAMKGVNDDEAVEFARLTLIKPLHIRFIELMPIAWNQDGMAFEDPLLKNGSGLISISKVKSGMLNAVQMKKMSISASAIQQMIESEFGPLEPTHIPTNGPARTWQVPGSTGTIGFISQISNDLCENCNRLRLTTDGFLRPCLMSDGEVDLRTMLRNGAGVSKIMESIARVISIKPERHYLAEGQHPITRTMSQIGG